MKVNYPNSRIVQIMSLTFLLLTFLNTRGQVKLKYDSVKARKETEAYNNQRKLDSSIKGKPLQKPEFRIEQKENYSLINFNDTLTNSKNFFQRLSAKMKFSDVNNFRLVSSRSDKDGYTHKFYDQYYKGIAVIGGRYVLHEKNGKLDFANGKFYDDLSVDVTPAISKDDAIKAALKFVGAKKYRWQNETAEIFLKKNLHNPDTSYYPRPELVIAPKGGIYKSENFRLCYKMYIESESPHRELDIYVDAHTAEIVHSVDQINYADVPGTANTYYNGAQAITTTSNGTYYSLEETGNRPIRTYNFLNKTDIDAAVVFKNKTNNWVKDLNIVRSVVINKVNNSWNDFEDKLFGGPNIYIEVRDISNTLLTKSRVNNNVTFPLTINMDDLPLLAGGKYSVMIYDRDIFTFDDLIASFTFSPSSALSGSFNFSNNGTSGVFVIVGGNSGALDAHWGMEKVYDYYKSYHGRLSYDGHNSTIQSYLHPNDLFAPGYLPNNAFWSQGLKKMFFGSGNGNIYTSFTALDIAGHEFTHGVISNGGSRLNNNTLAESGALNESFGDIFGTAIEFSVPGINHNWTLGENISVNGTFLRSMSNPKSTKDPDTYLGTYWYPGPNASTFVHKNTGVQNKWFYLLSQGGSGNIDGKASNDKYSVKGIGINSAAIIAYHNMMEILTPDATYNDAYLGSLMAADKYGFSNPSDGYRAVRAAWYAVGVAKKPVITSFTPTSGNEGTTVTISGKEFTGISYVGFNGKYVPAPQFNVNTAATEITVNVPTGATTGLISIIAGTDTVMSKDTFHICRSLDVTVTSVNASDFKVTATGGIAPYSYSLDNINFQRSDTFSNLATNRTYTAYAKDSGGCVGQTTFFVSDSLQCDIQQGSGGQGTTFITQILGKTAGSVSVNYQMYTIPDQMDVYYNNALVATTGGLVSGTGTLNFNYLPLKGGPYHCIIRIYAPNNGTAWDFIAGCPVSSIRKNSDFAGRNIENDFRDESLKAEIYPNPSSGNVNLNINDISNNVTITLSDVTGKVLWRSITSGNGTISIPAKHLSPGIYFVTLINTKHRETLRFIKNR